MSALHRSDHHTSTGTASNKTSHSGGEERHAASLRSLSTASSTSRQYLAGAPGDDVVQVPRDRARFDVDLDDIGAGFGRCEREPRCRIDEPARPDAQKDVGTPALAIRTLEVLDGQHLTEPHHVRPDQPAAGFASDRFLVGRAFERRLLPDNRCSTIA
jgi:hypothetical protein